MEFDCVPEEICPAPDTLIYAGLFDAVKSTCEWWLCTPISGDLVLFESQYLLPLRIRFANLIDAQYYIFTAVKYLYSFH